MLTEFDDREGYCRRLGHHLKFQYCRTVNEGLPCHLLSDCWFDKFPVTEFVERNYSPAEREKFSQPPQPKISSLVELINKARQG
jgi:hypothetical protein